MAWWQEVLPVMGAPARDDLELNREVFCSQDSGAPDPEKEDRVMLVRSRLSRILFRRKFFDYPVTLSVKTLTNLGLGRVVRILAWKTFSSTGLAGNSMPLFFVIIRKKSGVCPALSCR